MASTSKTTGRDGVLSMLDGLILALGIAKDACGIPPAQAAFASAVALLTTIRDTMVNQEDYVELGRSCADACKILDRGLNGKGLDNLPRSVLDAIEHFTTAMAVMRNDIIKQSKRSSVSRFLHSKVDKDKIVGWKQDLLRVLQIFNTELVINAVVILGDMQRNREETSRKQQPTQSSIPLGELPPPPPRSCFGRDKLIEKVVDLAKDLKPVALIGAGGIGKTSIARAVLHHSRIKETYGDNRRFIRCDQFPASRAQFLARISKVTGAGVENPDDLTSLRPFLSSRKIFLTLDNAESMLDPKGAEAQEINAIVNELCQIETVCLLITSRIRTVPRYCIRPEIPTLSMEAACDIFYDIYGDHNGRSDTIENLLRRLDFHALSITLLATTASHNDWSHDRLAEEWETHRAQVLRTDYDESLAASINLSLNSPTFLELGPHARDLLEVVAFFPQGVDEKNLNWFFPAISDRKNIFDKFCVLSLTYRNDSSITMLAPIRDYLSPGHPESSPLLCATKDQYFARLSVHLSPRKPRFAEARWIRSEDVNVEHLLDVFTAIDTSSSGVWDACDYFLGHLYWHKRRETILARKIEDLPDNHRAKPKCLFTLAELFGAHGNSTKRKQLLTHTLELQRQRGDNYKVASVLRRLSDTNRLLGLYEEGIEQAKEASKIYRQLNDTIGQAKCWAHLGDLFLNNRQLDAAEDAMSRAINSIPEKGQERLACQCHRILGNIYRSKRKKDKATHHLTTALGIASRLSWNNEVSWVHHSLATLFLDGNEFDKANTHVEQAKLHAVDDAYTLGRATGIQADIWYRQGRVEDAISEVRHAIEIFGNLGAVDDVEQCRHLLRRLNKQ